MKTIPLSVYRLQLNHLFPLSKVEENLDYFHSLGVHFLYFSPITKARTGSLHGYDGVDFEILNPEIGSEADLERLALKLRERKMGILLDIVPNHMSRSSENPWWVDVETKGQKSPFAKFFDIEWNRDGKIAFFRRFFDISDLISLRIEEPEVFDAVHRLPFKWLDKGWIQGLRIDHIDGLYYPQAYLDQVAKKKCYLVVEKILTGDEQLPLKWPVDGTTGYDFLNQLNGLFIDPKGFEVLRQIYAAFCGKPVEEMQQVIYGAKTEILNTTLSPEAKRLAALHPSPDIIPLLAHFPVYRTYLTPDDTPPSEQDRDVLEKGFKAAKLPFSDLKKVFFEKRNIPFIQFFQQVSGPAMAKGCEDTALYRDYPLASVNEVGMDPQHPYNTVERFHAQNLTRQPHTLLATSTHDTKRSEDVRARINVLSEVPEEWGASIRKWHANHPFSDPDIAYFIYQTLLGSWKGEGNYAERIQAYVLKACKEAKRQTSWVTPNLPYEQAVHDYISLLLSDAAFVTGMDDWYSRVYEAGLKNSIAQLILKMTSPGVPDLYQGQEEWQWTLVDPDNRQIIDYQKFDKNGRKQVVTRKLLALRQQNTDLFQKGSYEPIVMEQGIAFVRTFQKQQLLVFVDQFFLKESKSRQIHYRPASQGIFRSILDEKIVKNPTEFRDFALFLRS